MKMKLNKRERETLQRLLHDHINSTNSLASAQIAQQIVDKLERVAK